MRIFRYKSVCIALFSFFILFTANSNVFAHHCNFTVSKVDFGIVDPLRIEGTEAQVHIALDCWAVTSPTHYCVVLTGSDPERFLTLNEGRNTYQIPFNFYNGDTIFGGDGVGKGVNGTAYPEGGHKQKPVVTLTAKLGRKDGLNLVNGIYQNKFTAKIYGAYGSRQTLTDAEQEALCSGGKGVPGVGFTDTPQHFTVSAQIKESCSVTADAVNFGIAPRLESVKDTEGSVRVRCSQKSDVNIALSPGQNAIGNTNIRAMKCAEPDKCKNSTISYGLYQDSSHMKPWGSKWGSEDVMSSTVDNTITAFPVYAGLVRGRGDSTPLAGKYSDIVIVTVRYSGKA